MSTEHPYSRRDDQPFARQLQSEVSEALEPIAEDLAELSPGFDGITLFWPDRRQNGVHFDTVADVATAQPLYQSDDERFAFYRGNIAKHHVRLAGTALQASLLSGEAGWHQSGMNPDHMTYGGPVAIDNDFKSIVQSVYSQHYGKLPNEHSVASVWKKHNHTFRAMTDTFHALDKRIESIGDTLELDLPTVPNAYIVNWDLIGSTRLSREHYGAMRNFLIDTKDCFDELMKSHDKSYDDTGDGTNIILWLARHDEQSITHFGETEILSLVGSMQAAAEEISRKYQDITPQLKFVVGLGSIEQEFTRYDKYTSDEFWRIGEILKNHPGPGTVAFTPSAQKRLPNL